MSFIATPTDQPDWAATAGAFGGPLDDITAHGPGAILGNKVLVSGSPSTLITFDCLDPTGVLNISMNYFDASGMIGFQTGQTITVNGICFGTLVIPNAGPILQIQLTVTALAVGNNFRIRSYQCGMQVAEPESVTRSAAIGNTSVVGAGAPLTVPGNILLCGDATFTVVTNATAWSATIYGTSATTDLLCATGGPGFTQTVTFKLPPHQPTIQIVNNDAVARVFVYNLSI